MITRVTKALGYLLLAPALLPLIYVDGLLYPYLTPKTLLLRGIGIVIAAAIAFLILSGRAFHWERLRTKAAWIPGALLVVAYIASLFGIDFYHSFWSIFDRGDGLLSLTVIVIYFYTTLLYADRAFLDTLCKVAAWAGSIVAIYTALQWLQGTTGMNIPIIAAANGRFGGTLGNAAFLAAYLGMTFFATLIIAWHYRGKWRIAAYAGAIFQLIAILISSTRGTLLALVASALVASAYLAWKGNGRTRTYARVGVISLVALAGVFFVFRGALSHAPIEPVRRIASISLADATVSSRVFIWQHMLTEGMKRPILGYGAEHISVPFNLFYDPTGIQEQWFDRSHNAYLDYFIQFGVLGLGFFLALIAAFARTVFTLMRKGERHGAFLMLLLITYATQNFFVFDTASTLWLFFMLYAGALILRDDSKESKLALPLWWPGWAPAVVGVAILVLLIPVSIQPLRANLLLADAYLYHIVDARRAADDMQKGIKLGTYADLEYGYQAYEMYTERQMTMLSGEARVIAYRNAAAILAANFARYPYDARTATYYAHVLDSSPPEIPIDETTLRAAIEHAIKLSPKRMQPWYLLANISLRKADQMQAGAGRTALYKEGIGELERYAAIVPTLAEPRYAIATLYLTIGDTASAKQWADEALPLYTTDLAVAKRAARYYLTIEDWPNAARFMEDIVRAEPDNIPQYYDLAKAQWLAGNKARAREIVEKLKIDAPGLFESDPNFVKEYNKAQ
jgi:O-antigen ligase/tetratricopeptide (TPR) repeat protein